MREVQYSLAIGYIMHAMIRTLLYMSYVFSVASKDQSDPWKEHWLVVKRII
jgi:hypothetical protein